MAEEAHGIELLGCTPEPLMAYLKALGVLRLVTEQKRDANVRGWWHHGVFSLRSPVLFEGTQTDEEMRRALAKFFLDDYAPTPIVAPWGARSGFYAGSSEKTARIALEAISASESIRLESFRRGIERVRALLIQLGVTEKGSDEEKISLLRQCRSCLPDELLPWLDTCVVLTSKSRRYPPLLGTGGNEGSGSYASGFAQQVVECVLKRAHDEALEVSLFGHSARGALGTQTPGHFSPTAAGGANGTQGFEASTNTNPWDFLLCIEGACLWASAAVRRMGTVGSGMAAFPFTVNVCGSGSTSLAFSDGKKPKQAKRDIAEMWLPLWERGLSASEVHALLSEGRASIGGRPAETGLDLARAASTLGVDRGIRRFVRTAFLMRNGQSFLSIPLGSFDVRERIDVDLIRDVDWWLNGFRRAAGDAKAPPRFKAALRGIEHAVFDLCLYGGKTQLQAVLMALGRAERELALTAGRVGHSKTKPHPLSNLSRAWSIRADDGSTEFRTARALAAIYDPRFKIGPVRCNLEDADWKNRRRAWANQGGSVAWSSADLCTNLASVLERRIMDGKRAGCERLPLASPFFVSLEAVAAFIEGDVDERRLESLLWGLMLVEQKGRSKAVNGENVLAADMPLLPRDYALLKILFLPQPIVPLLSGDRIRWRLAFDEEPGIAIRPEPRILPLLRAGRVGDACSIAASRLRVSGLPLMRMPLPGGGLRNDSWSERPSDLRRAQRLAAALILPVSSQAVNHLLHLVCRDDLAGIETLSLLEEGETA